MDSEASDIRSRIRQQLESDKLLGMREVPISREVVSAIGSRPNSTAAVKPAAAAALPAQMQSSGASAGRLRLLDETQVQSCRKCPLSETRTNTVFGQGSAQARLMFVGEAPGFEEDRQGLAFVGRAGQLLTKMIEAMGLAREDVFICNVLKCRPPNNRTPASAEIASCSPYLFEQIRIIEPEILCALGAPAAQTLLDTREGIGRLRGRFHEFRAAAASPDDPAIPLMPTYHPAYLLRSPGEKRKSWEDLQMIMVRLAART